MQVVKFFETKADHMGKLFRLCANIFVCSPTCRFDVCNNSGKQPRFPYKCRVQIAPGTNNNTYFKLGEPWRAVFDTFNACFGC